MTHILIAGGIHETARALGIALREMGASVHFGDALPLLEPDLLRAAIADLGAFDALIYAPPCEFAKPFMETSDEAWAEMLCCNFEQAVWAAQAFAHTLIAQKRAGSIVFLSSVAAQMPLLTLSALGTTQAAVHTLAKMAAVDLAPHNIRVNVIACGLMVEASRQHIQAGTPTAQLTSVQDIAGVCSFLVSPAARNITGAILTVDGGYTLTRSAGTSVWE
jgi:NAD(P)-dependent dehydrogenase (short-subunit alcohol dehydrogenase family)